MSCETESRKTDREDGKQTNEQFNRKQTCRQIGTVIREIETASKPSKSHITNKKNVNERIRTFSMKGKKSKRR